MNKIYSLLILFLGLSFFTACEDDNDSNPTYKDPTTFNLNVPKYISGIYDLKNTESVQMTCSQPDYGFTAATIYTVQISLTNTFTEDEYRVLPTTYSSALMEVNAGEMAVALSDMLGYANEEEYPENYIFPVFVRLQASLANGLGTILSNVIELPEVLSYFALNPMVMPENMYMIGNVAGNWDWTAATKMVPVHSNDGKFWAIQYLGLADDGEKAAIKFNTVADWDGGQFGIEGAIIDDASMTLAGISGSDNIEIGNPGWYLVVVTTEIDGRDYKYHVEFLPPNIYSTGDPSGGYDVFDEARLFTVPEGKGEFVSPAFVASGELRICVKLVDIDWWKSEFVILNGKIEYRGTGGDQDRVNVSAEGKAYLDFINGTGRVE